MTVHETKFPKVHIALDTNAEIGSGSSLDHFMIDRQIESISRIVKNLPGYMELFGSDHGWKDVLDPDTVKKFQNFDEEIYCEMRSGHYMHIVHRDELDEWHFHCDTGVPGSKPENLDVTINEYWHFDTKTEAKEEMRIWIQALSINPYIKSQNEMDNTMSAHDLIMQETT